MDSLQETAERLQKDCGRTVVDCSTTMWHYAEDIHLYGYCGYCGLLWVTTVSVALSQTPIKGLMIGWVSAYAWVLQCQPIIYTFLNIMHPFVELWLTFY